MHALIDWKNDIRFSFIFCYPFYGVDRWMGNTAHQGKTMEEDVLKKK